MGKQWKQCQTLFFWAPKSLQMVTAIMKLKDGPQGSVSVNSLSFTDCVQVLLANTLMTSAGGKD